MYEQNGDSQYSQINGLRDCIPDHAVSKRANRLQCSRDVELLRLIGQYLCDKGLNGAYSQLSKESGISLEHDDATELRRATLEGRWSDAEAAVDRLTPLIDNAESVEEVRFLLLEQRFLEHLEANEVMPAVTLLRNRITPMQRNTERVHTLASCLMCRTNSELRAQAGGWTGKDAGSRLQLINRIQAFVPAQAMLPPRRLEELVDDSVRSQLSTCIFHNPSHGSALNMDTISLLQRHSCGMQDFPSFCIQTVHQREGELWLCQFSPDGLYLAVGGKDGNVDLFRVDAARHTITRFRVLTTTSYIFCLCWSPNSKKLATCCGEEQSSVYVFDVHTGQQLCNQKVNEEDTYSSAAFFADSRKLAFGGLKGIFYVMDTEDQGRILTSVEGYRVQSMAAIISQPPLIHVNDSALDKNSRNPMADIAAPGAPDSLQLVGGVHTGSYTSANGPSDQLLIADSLHRIRLFRFGYLGTGATNLTGSDQPLDGADITVNEAAVNLDVSGTQLVASTAGQTGIDVTTPSPTPADLTVYLTAGSNAPGAPGSAAGVGSMAGNNPSTISTGTSTTTAGILFDMPILPVSFTRLGSPQSQRPQQHQQQQTQPNLRPAIQTGSTLGGTPYTVVSSAGGGSGSGLTILFGTPLERSASIGTTAIIPSGTRALSAASAALAGPHSRSFAGLVHSLVTTSSSSFEAGTGRTSVADTSVAPLTISNTSSSSMAHTVASSTGFVPTTVGSGPSGAMTGEGTYGLLDHRTLFKETHPVQSITMSRSGQRALITTHKMGLNLWDVESHAILHRFIGYKQDTFRLHSTFGGVNENFVATGSENGRINIWNTNGGNHPIHSASTTVNGGGDAVTCVHWNPVIPTMIASVNDVGEICIWAPQRASMSDGV